MGLIGKKFPKATWAVYEPLGPIADDTAFGKGVVALLSDFFTRTTGEIIHVDGGFHAVGA